jgi:c-di-AMP phosphodiesterase-like protein
MKNNKSIKRLSEPGVGIHLFFMILFAAATLYFKQYFLAAAEGGVILVLLVFSLIARRVREKQLSAYIESVAYDSENAKDNTLKHFPLPIAVFRLDDANIVWGNEMFFSMCGVSKKRMDVRITDLVPEFTGKWLTEGKNRYPGVLQLQGKKYQVHGNLIRSEKEAESDGFLGITYWLDITEYDDIRLEYEHSRPVPGIVVIDNLDELCKNLPERARTDLRDEVEDKLHHWCEGYHGILRRYDRDRYFVMFEKRDLDGMREEKFRIIEEVHKVESPNGISASISVGLGVEASTMAEALQFADMAVELALSRGGDQAVIKNRLSFEFFGGRGSEVEKRTKVKSRVMANTLAELMRDSSKVYVMGHRFADLDALGAAVGICSMARFCGVRANIVMDLERNASKAMIARLKEEKEYKDVFLTKEEAILSADGRTLLVVVDTNRPEQVEDAELLSACNRVAVIDHHRRGSSYIEKMALNYHEPYASSASELVTELLQYLVEPVNLLRAESEALLAGIVLDTKNFTNRTGGRTFEAAAYLRRAGADTQEVQRMFQSDLQSMITRYGIIRQAELYRKDLAIAALDEEYDRVTAAKAADELLTLQGVQASFVLYRKGDGVYISARSLGEVNVQVIVEALGGGGNSTTAGGELTGRTVTEAKKQLMAAIDHYFDK